MYVHGLEQGGVYKIARNADPQDGPKCGFEALENIVQLFRRASNDLSRVLIEPLARAWGYVTTEGTLDPAGYIPILNYFGISAHWSPFDHRVLSAALHQDRVALAVVDAKVFYGQPFAPEAWHAIMLSNFAVDHRNARLLRGYTGADSNCPGNEMFWPAKLIADAATATYGTPLLITDQRATWPDKVSHFVYYNENWVQSA